MLSLTINFDKTLEETATDAVSTTSGERATKLFGYSSEKSDQVNEKTKVKIKKKKKKEESTP